MRHVFLNAAPFFNRSPSPSHPLVAWLVCSPVAEALLTRRELVGVLLLLQSLRSVGVLPLTLKLLTLGLSVRFGVRLGE